MKVREYMETHDADMDFCNCYISDDKQDAVVFFGTMSDTVLINGVDAYTIPDDANELLRKKHNLYTLIDIKYHPIHSKKFKHCCCRECPCFKGCGSMDDDVEECSNSILPM